MSETSAPVPVPVAKHDVPTKNKELEEHVEEAEEAQDLDRFKKSLSDSVDRLSVVFDKLGKPRPGLDESFYQLEDKEAEFFKQQTGISDDEELKQHITKIQTEAYAVSISNSTIFTRHRLFLLLPCCFYRSFHTLVSVVSHSQSKSSNILGKLGETEISLCATSFST